jgi:hypothetical protein
MGSKCEYLECCEISQLRCSGCRLVFYCTKDHQKKDWKSHKHTCKSLNKPTTNAVIEHGVTNKVSSEENPIQSENSELKECRCMFCGETLFLASEEAAIDHMKECIALQEQLASKDQFTIPSMVKEKMKNEENFPFL